MRSDIYVGTEERWNGRKEDEIKPNVCMLEKKPLETQTNITTPWRAWLSLSTFSTPNTNKYIILLHPSAVSPKSVYASVSLLRVIDSITFPAFHPPLYLTTDTTHETYQKPYKTYNTIPNPNKTNFLQNLKFNFHSRFPLNILSPCKKERERTLWNITYSSPLRKSGVC